MILSPIEQSIKQKIESVGTPLKDWDIQIYRGVLTGYNEAFIISTEKRDEILANCKTEDEKTKTDELIRPILRGRDIKRYSYDWANLYLIATFPSRQYDIEDYPAVKAHLLSYGKERLEQTGKKYVVNGEEIKARKKTNNKWFETQDSISYWDDFSKHKIVYREISDEMNACLIKDEVYVNNKCYIVTGEHLEHLICVLNSKLFNKIILQSANLTGGKGRDFLNTITVPKPENNSKLQELYEEMISLPIKKQSKLNSQIDYEVCLLYSLSDEEIAYIDSL